MKIILHLWNGWTCEREYRAKHLFFLNVYIVYSLMWFFFASMTTMDVMKGSTYEIGFLFPLWMSYVFTTGLAFGTYRKYIPKRKKGWFEKIGSDE